MKNGNLALFFACAGALGWVGWNSIILSGINSAEAADVTLKGSASVWGASTNGRLGNQYFLMEKNSDKRRRLMTAWAETVDIPTIAAELENVQVLADDALRNDITRILLETWADRDLVGLAQWFGRRDAADRLHQESRDLLTTTLAGWESEAAVTWLKETLPLAASRELFGSYFRARAIHEPLEVGTQLLGLCSDTGEDRLFWQDLMGQLASQWGSSDFDAAVAWVRALHEGESKTAALLQLSTEWVEKAPAEAAAYATSRQDLQLVARVSESWAQQDAGATLAWVLGLPPGQMHDHALLAVMKVFADEDIALAAIAVEAISPGWARDHSVVMVAERYAEQSPETAISWIDRFVEGPMKDQCIRQLSAIWGSRDHEGADRWLRSLPKGETRDVAIDAFVSAINSTSPAYGFEWANKIGGVALRNQSLERAALAWLRIEADVAAGPVLGSPLPVAIKKQLLASPDE